MKTAIYPGSFDPITLGHLDIILRVASVFDKVVVCVMVNAGKRPHFTEEQRVDMIRRVVEKYPKITVDSSSGLLAEYSKKYEQPVVVKGLRAMSDFESEFQMALINKRINPDLDTLFMASSEKYTYLSSSLVRELAEYAADISEFVPAEIISEVTNKMQSGRITRSKNKQIQYPVMTE
ncbi:MAG: pantetheine-phosphate adenylyltransferase [Oscillospiraceae bacterium]|nr:pantetheine-phosphate adenylyltransferase [Oscillospiraceae bacterium]